MKNYLDLFNRLQAGGPQQDEHPNSRVLVVDGLNTFIRSYSVSPVTNTNGEHVGGIAGFLLSVGHAIKTINPTRVVVVFDGKDGSAKRRALYSEYKAHRKLKVRLNRSDSVDKEDNQLKQLMRVLDYLSVLPTTTLIVDRSEADDVIAYIARSYFEGKDSQVFIMSSDKDFMQLVDQKTFVWSPTKKKLFFAEDVYTEFGVIPENFALYRALTGDASDNIPGVRGLGAKTLLQRFPVIAERQPIHIEQFFDYVTVTLDSNPKSKLHCKVLDSKDDVRTFYKITQLSESMISGQLRLGIVARLNEPIHRLARVSFHTMLIEDGMTQALKNADFWLTDIAQKLDRFALMTHQDNT